MNLKKRMWLFSGVGVALVVGIVVMANVFGHFLYARLDLSRGRVYSVSRASKKILRALPDPVHVTVYSSKELPPQVAVVRNYLRDILAEYASGSGGKVRPKYVEVGEDPKAREEAIKAGIAPVRFDIFTKEKFEQREGFLGLTIQFQDKKDTIAFLRDSNGLEYDLTSRIRLLASKSKPTLGFVSDQQSLASSSLDPELAARLKARYEMRDVSLESVSISSGAPKTSFGTAVLGDVSEGVPAEIGVLCLIGPQGKLPDKALSLLEQYLTGGRALIVAASAKKVDVRSYSAVPLDAGLGPFLSRAGISMDATLVMDAQSQMIQVQMQQGPYIISNVVQYPPLVVVNDLSRDNPATKDINGVMLPFVSPIKISTQTQSAAIEVLARSSKMSWAKTPSAAGYLHLTPFEFPPPEASDLKGPFILAAAVTPQAGKGGRLAVIGTSKFLDRDLGRNDAGGNFFMNIVDWASQDSDLIAIRSKEVRFRPLREVSVPIKTLVRYLNMFLPSALVIGLGLWKWKRRSRRRIQHAAQFGPSPLPARTPVEVG